MEMRTVRRTTSMAAFVATAALAATLGARPASAQSPGAEQAVKQTVHAFHDALAAGDSARALDLLHPDVRVYESGHAETFSEYRSGHLSADMRFSAATERELLSEEVTLAPGGDGALYLSTYQMRGRVGDREIDVHGTETMVLVPGSDGSWRILHIHWSSR